MDGTLPLLATSAATAVSTSFPWLSLIVLLPAAAALLLPLLPGDPADPRPPRLVALVVLLVDMLLMGWTFSQHFDGSLSTLQLVERVSWVPVIHLEWSLAADGLSAPLVVLSGLALALSGDTFSLNLTELANRSPGGTFGLLCYLGFLIGFGVKLPMFPLHTWLPDAHGEANAPVSMLLAGVLLKMGGYALLRFNVQLLPAEHMRLAPALMVLGIVNIIWGALNAFAQDNVKRRIACSSVSHMGFVLLGIGAVDALGLSGAMLQMISHGLIAAAMFFVTGVFYERTKTLSIPNMGGLAKVLPITFAFFLASSLASLALPGMSGFVSEITVFLGITANPYLTPSFRVVTIVLAAIGLVLTPIYLLSLCRRVFFGPRIPALAMVGDMTPRELVIGMCLLVPTLVIGFWPRVAIDFYQASTAALAGELASQTLALVGGLSSLG